MIATRDAAETEAGAATAPHAAVMETAKVCFLIEDFYPVMHGATTQLLQLAKRLAGRGCTVTVITRRVSAEHPVHEAKDGYRIVRVMPAIGMHRLGKYLMIVPAFAALYRYRRVYDVIVVCDLKALGVVGVFAAKWLGKWCVLRAESCGEMDGSYATDGLESTALARVVERAVRLRNRILLGADRFVSISSAIEEELARCGVAAAKIVKLPNGVDVERFVVASPRRKQEIRRVIGLCTHARIFVYTGRLAHGKGLDVLLSAWRDVSRQNSDVRLLLVGSGQGYASSCEAELRAYVAHHRLTESVTFTGNVENVAEYLQAADYFVLPSRTESFGLSLLEAMACGLPCIASSVGGVKDIVADGVDGQLIPYGDATSLAQAMETFLRDPDGASRLGMAARRKAVELFAMDAVADRYLHLFAAGNA